MKRVVVQPSWRTIQIIQDKYLQKEHLVKYGFPTVVSNSLKLNEEELMKFGKDHGFPFMLKARREAYNRRGNHPVNLASVIREALEALKGRLLYAEKWAWFKKELAVMVVKTIDKAREDRKSTIAYLAVETVHEDSICKLVYSPLCDVSEQLQKQA
jgi:phosphoribosylaminoimidazole carboxylase